MSDKTETKWYETVKAKAVAGAAVLVFMGLSASAIQTAAQYIGLPAQVAALVIKVDAMGKTVDKIWEKLDK
ncbi:hypothetical protein LCGC14_0915040 [marine sediment metagenome]|uniref:Uncharacterized protein n=1 Tax=marine sediment metagenome TaxID=412755 RepID=A0A0F9NX94_9ZZZZ